MNKTNKLYDVVWKINGVVKETIRRQVPKPLALYIKKNVESTTHKTGKVEIV